MNQENQIVTIETKDQAFLRRTINDAKLSTPEKVELIDEHYSDREGNFMWAIILLAFALCCLISYDVKINMASRYSQPVNNQNSK